jgi:dienelactone hydrolase
MKHPALVFLLMLLTGSGIAVAAEAPAINSPAELWQGYDPEALPLEIESLQRWTENDTAFEKLRFTSEAVEGGKVRVLAVVGKRGNGEPRPGILHIHGGGQTLSLEWVKFWTQRGYVCATFDFCGAWENRKEFTDWGPLKQGNMAHAAGGFQVRPTPRESSWYHWTIAARRALTLLASQPEVDRRRLGIFGISMGGTLCWSVAASDSRVKTAVPIYGCGYNVDGQRTQWGFPKLTPELALFQRAVSPEAHAPYIACPVLFLNATNDFHGWMDRSYDILAATPSPHWQSYTPRFNHHIAAAQGANLPLWMDFQLKGGPAFPRSPEISLALGADGIPQAQVDAADSPARIEVFYALGNRPSPNRFWRSVNAEQTPGRWTAALPVIDTWEPLNAFANVHYDSGVCLTTNLVVRTPGVMGKARSTLSAHEPIEPRLLAESWFYGRAHTDPFLERQYVLVESESDRPHVVRMNPEVFGETQTVDISSHAVGDPQFIAPANARLTFDVQGDFGAEGLRITLAEHDWTPLAKFYTATIANEGTPSEWRTIELSLEDFRLKDAGTSLATWDELDKINLQGTTPRSKPFRLANLRWSSEPGP